MGLEMTGGDGVRLVAQAKEFAPHTTYCIIEQHRRFSVGMMRLYLVVRDLLWLQSGLGYGEVGRCGSVPSSAPVVLP